MDFATVPAAPPAWKKCRATSWPAPISAKVPYFRSSRLIVSALRFVVNCCGVSIIQAMGRSILSLVYQSWACIQYHSLESKLLLIVAKSPEKMWCELSETIGGIVAEESKEYFREFRTGDRKDPSQSPRSPVSESRRYQV